MTKKNQTPLKKSKKASGENNSRVVVGKKPDYVYGIAILKCLLNYGSVLVQGPHDKAMNIALSTLRGLADYDVVRTHKVKVGKKINGKEVVFNDTLILVETRKEESPYFSLGYRSRGKDE